MSDRGSRPDYDAHVVLKTRTLPTCRMALYIAEDMIRSKLVWYCSLQNKKNWTKENIHIPINVIVYKGYIFIAFEALMLYVWNSSPLKKVQRVLETNPSPNETATKRLNSRLLSVNRNISSL